LLADESFRVAVPEENRILVSTLGPQFGSGISERSDKERSEPCVVGCVVGWVGAIELLLLLFCVLTSTGVLLVGSGEGFGDLGSKCGECVGLDLELELGFGESAGLGLVLEFGEGNRG